MRWIIESVVAEKERRDVILWLSLVRQGSHRVTSNSVLLCLTLVNQLEKIGRKY